MTNDLTRFYGGRGTGLRSAAAVQDNLGGYTRVASLCSWPVPAVNRSLAVCVSTELRKNVQLASAEAGTRVGPTA